MRIVLKKAALITGAVIWFAFALLLSFLLLKSVGQSNELQLIALSFSGSALIGLIHFVGFAVAAALSFTMSIALSLHAFVPEIGKA